MEFIILLVVVAGLAGGVFGVKAKRRSGQQALPSAQPQPAPKPEAPIEGYHTLAEIWDHTLSGAATVNPEGNTQYAPGSTAVQAFGSDFSTLTAAKITTDTLHASTFEDVHLFRTLAQDAYVRASPYRKSEYVRIAEAGSRERVVGYVHGEPFGGAGTSTDIWFVLEDESVVWSGYFTNKSSVGLYPYDVDEPEIFEQKSFSGRVVSTVTTYPTVRKPYAA